MLTSSPFKSPTKSSSFTNVGSRGSVSRNSIPIEAETPLVVKSHSQPLSTQKESIKRHIQSIESLKKRSKKVKKKGVTCNVPEN
jgi:hypothetical protein